MALHDFLIENKKIVQSHFLLIILVDDFFRKLYRLNFRLYGRPRGRSSIFLVRRIGRRDG